MGVPKPLRRLVGKRELVKSLETTDYKRACELVCLEESTAREIIRNAYERVEGNGKKPSLHGAPQRLVLASEHHARELARQWFVKIERDASTRWSEHRHEFSETEKAEFGEDLQWREWAITEQEKVHPTNHDDGTDELRAFLSFHNFTLDNGSPDFELLARFFRESRLEQIRRQIDRLNGRPVRAHETLFRDLTEHSQFTPVKSGTTLGKLCADFLAEYEKAKKAPKTISQYRVTVHLLREFFGSNRAAPSITREDAEKFCTMLETLPAHRVNRYRDKSIQQALAAANKSGDDSRLAPNTLRNRFFSAFTIFKFAAEMKYVPENPFNDRLLKQRFTPKDSDSESEKNRPPFTVEQLRKIFSAPLFTGCQDDQKNYAKAGSKIIRRGRFWVPLIGLFHGARENEICQIHTADIGEYAGGLFVEIRAGEDKRIKNTPSKRALPIHPELLRMGFANYVKERRADAASPRLFPELSRAKTGSYSDVFSKWFSRFLRHIFGSKIAPTFHSFRHNFTDACRKARIAPQMAARLCGWAGQETRQQRQYGGGDLIEILAEDLASVAYPGLDLSHLYAVQPGASETQGCRLRRRTRPRAV